MQRCALSLYDVVERSSTYVNFYGDVRRILLELQQIVDHRQKLVIRQVSKSNLPNLVEQKEGSRVLLMGRFDR